MIVNKIYIIVNFNVIVMMVINVINYHIANVNFIAIMYEIDFNFYAFFIIWKYKEYKMNLFI
jgi:hypothetical protein